MAACFEDLNAEWFASISHQVNTVSSPAELQALVNQVYGTIALLNSTIASQQLFMDAFALLLVPPVDLATVITWITGAITVMTNMYAPQAKMLTQVAAIAAQVATTTALIESVAASKFPGTSITIPSVAPFCEL